MTSKILFIDDEASLLNAIQRRYGFEYEVTTASSGQEGLDLLQSDGPFAVVLTDMRMPQMNGIEFLVKARLIAPDTVYIMLTGNQDQATAIQALNQGQVFRFLNKPCNNVDLQAALQAGLKQYRLVTGEKELLHKTFCGAIGVLTDLLESSHPEFFSCSADIEEMASRLRQDMKIEDRWEFRVAAKLSLIGFALMPQAERASYLSCSTEDAPWLASIERASALGARMIQHIPRLESVAEMIAATSKTDGHIPSAQGEARPDLVAVGAVLLRVAMHANHLACCGVEAEQGIGRITEALPRLPSEIRAGLEEAWPDTAAKPIVELALKDLNEGMILAEDVVGNGGAVLVRRGRRLSATIVAKLRCHEELIRAKGSFRLYEHSVTA